MSTKYRISRNLEKSLMDFIEDKLSENEWSNIRIEKSFARVYKGKLPVLCVRLSDTEHIWNEIGNTSTRRQPLILIDILTKSDGQRLDLKDCLISELKNGFPYYEYTIEKGKVTKKVKKSKVSISSLTDEPVDMDVDKENLDVKDRHRHLIELSCRLTEVEK